LKKKQSHYPENLQAGDKDLLWLYPKVF